MSSPTTAPSPPATTGPVAFESARYRYRINLPSTWEATPAASDWTFTDRLDNLTPAADSFIEPDAAYPVLLTAFADEVPAGVTEDDWITDYYEGTNVDGVNCAETIKFTDITVGGRSATLGTNDECFDVQAFVFSDGQVHVFAIWRGTQSALLQRFLSSVRFLD
ncbi:MAG: hypothetical protein ABI797_07005 [Chloroflexota bacterium]